MMFRFHENVGKGVSPSIFSSRKEGLRVCVISPQKDVYSETFIKAHIEKLPFEIFPLHGAVDSLLAEQVLGKLIGFVDRSLGKSLTQRSLSELYLAMWLRKVAIDCVLAEYGPTGVEVLRACQSARVPLVVHFHGFDASHGPTLAAYREEYRRLFGAAKKIIAVSRHMIKSLSDLGAPKEKLELNPYGVDPDRFIGSSPESFPPIFLAVGRFSETKAPFLTLLAIAEALSHRPELRLIMVGDGVLLEACKTLAKALRIENAVEFLGPRSPEEVQDLMRRSRAFLQHSVTVENGDAEGTPVAIIEAQMSGLPVIATRHAGIPDVVIEGETGFLVDEGDVGAMAKAIIAVADQPALAARMGSAARARALQFFTLRRHIDGLAVTLQQSARR
jgi:colanic acid/amylovoran biosynthesis glycosyltransferase